MDTEAPVTRPRPEPPEGASRPRRRRLLWIGLALLVLVLSAGGLVAVSVLAEPARAGGVNDTSAAGHAAVAQLLRDEQVRTTESGRLRDTLTQARPDTTVVVSDLTELPVTGWRQLLEAEPGRIVLFSPTGQDLRRLGIDIAALGTLASPEVEPHCSDPAAQRAGGLLLPSGSRTYRTSAPVVQCYPGEQGHYVVLARSGASEILIMPDVAANDSLPEAGNAALAMQLLGSRPTLSWWVVDRGDPGFTEQGHDSDTGEQSPSLLPPGWIHAAWLAVVALVVIAVWQGRRLGPILVEELPVVVPAAETVEGHGRLYARLGARDTAASHFRTAAVARLARLLGHAPDPETLAQALADRTGRPYGEIRALLDGAAPTTDDALVALKRNLDALEQEARRP